MVEGEVDDVEEAAVARGERELSLTLLICGEVDICIEMQYSIYAYMEFVRIDPDRQSPFFSKGKRSRGYDELQQIK